MPFCAGFEKLVPISFSLWWIWRWAFLWWCN